ncbi:hypothetical protein LINPERHAP2_LOCUS33458 [Linum perenne]
MLRWDTQRLGDILIDKLRLMGRKVRVVLSGAQKTLVLPRKALQLSLQRKNMLYLWQIRSQKLVWSQVQVLEHSAQFVLLLISGVESFCICFVYGSNSLLERRRMYEAVQFQLSGPLCVLGDFNAIVSPDEGSNVTGYTASMREFGDWINDNNLLDHRVIGPLYTWHNNRLDGIIYRRLDRCLVNLSWTSIFPGSVVELLAPGFSDHCGVLLNTDMNVASLPKSFKFFNCWIQNKDYDKIVAEAWERVNVVDPNNGFHRVYAKLKEVKNALKQLNKDQFSDVSRRVIEAEENLKAAQMALLTSSGLVDVEEVKVCKGKWIELRNAEESLYRQKSRENWLKLGDSNTAYFHRAVKIKQVKKQIGYLELSNGAISSNMGEITQEIVSYYMNLLVQQLLFGKATTASTWEQEVGLSAGLFAGNSSVAKKSRESELAK